MGDVEIFFKNSKTIMDGYITQFKGMNIKEFGGILVQDRLLNVTKT